MIGADGERRVQARLDGVVPGIQYAAVGPSGELPERRGFIETYR